MFSRLASASRLSGVSGSRDVTLYINPTNGFGDDVTPVYPNGKEVTVIYANSPYRSVADQYNL